MRGRAAQLAGSIVSAPHSIENLAQFAGRFVAEPGFLGIEFVALLAQLFERVSRARFGPGHVMFLSLAVGPLRACR
jgi:hypothetical protein